MIPILSAAATVFRLNHRLVLSCLDGMDDEVSRRRLSDNTNHAAFLVAHLAGARHFLLGLLGVETADPFPELAEARSIEDVERFPSVEELREAWRELGERLEATWGELDEERLAADSPQPFPVEDGSLLGAIAFLAQHESYHVGQLAMLRKAHGLGAMTYPQ
jgi:uncharacterized damage-inducible protein DinB